MAGITTCIGFGALLLTDVPATRELGFFAIVGVVAVSLISLTAVPAALVLLERRAGESAGSEAATAVSVWFGRRLEQLLDGLARFAVAHAGAVLAFWAVLTVAALIAIPRIQVDTDFITFFDESSRVRSDFGAVNRLLAGVVPIQVTITGTAEGAFREPRTLGAVARLQRELEAVPGVTEVLSSVDLIRVANQAMMEGDPAEARIPETRAALAELTFLLPKDKLRPYATSNHSRGNLIVRSDRSGSAAVRELEARIRAVLERADLPDGFSSDVIGNTILLNRGADGIAGHQATQVGLAAVAIFVLIIGVFRSLRVAWIAMIPNVVPVILFFGILGLGTAPLSLPTSLIGSIALGIAIDDTMHFLVAYSSQRASGCEAADAITRCMHQVGRPIVMTSLMLVVGFLVIVTSGFATLREFGYLTALTMAICLGTDLLLLPALLARFRA
jgi:predicted RND superfamily exporter protein